MTDFKVEFELEGTTGDASCFTLLVHPSWAPLGAARFRQLVEAEFYDDNRFFRVLDGDAAAGCTMACSSPWNHPDPCYAYP